MAVTWKACCWLLLAIKTIGSCFVVTRTVEAKSARIDHVKGNISLLLYLRNPFVFLTLVWLQY
jgi:hypothetical protein